MWLQNSVATRWAGRTVRRRTQGKRKSWKSRLADCVSSSDAPPIASFRWGWELCYCAGLPPLPRRAIPRTLRSYSVDTHGLTTRGPLQTVDGAS
jgi:hypothetical protein